MRGERPSSGLWLRGCRRFLRGSIKESSMVTKRSGNVTSKSHEHSGGTHHRGEWDETD